MADIKTIDDENFAGKKVLVRVDFNAPVDADGNVLEGLTIGVQSTTTGDLYSTWYMEDEGLATVQRYNKGADAVAALVSGKIDCVIIDNEPARAFVEANNN